eukprot:jgi/Botrbrau1/21812/Bobra.0190s0032.1
MGWAALHENSLSAHTFRLLRAVRDVREVTKLYSNDLSTWMSRRVSRVNEESTPKPVLSQTVTTPKASCSRQDRPWSCESRADSATGTGMRHHGLGQERAR